MDEHLAKVDELRRRFNVSYKEATEVLEQAGGDLVAALIQLEEKSKADTEEMYAKGPEMWSKVKEKVKDGSKKKIVISKEGRTVAQIPAPVGALGVLGALVSTPFAVIAGAGTVAALANNYKFKIHDEEAKNFSNPEEDNSCNSSGITFDEPELKDDYKNPL